MIFGKKEWVSEISGIFFFALWRKKKCRIISHREKNTGLFSLKVSISDRKKQNYFSKLSTPIFLPKLWIPDEKTDIIFGPKLGISDGNKKYRLISVKTVYFWRKLKNTHYFCQNRQKVVPEKKIQPARRSGWVPSVSFPGKKKKRRHLCWYPSEFWLSKISSS